MKEASRRTAPDVSRNARRDIGRGRPASMWPMTVEWKGTHIRIIDQTLLPVRLKYARLSSVEEVADAIKTMKIRGAPAIGVVASLGVALSARGHTESQARRRALRAVEVLGSTRPTAVNLSWALERMRRIIEGESFVHRAPSTRAVRARNRASIGRSLSGQPLAGLPARLLSEALEIWDEDRKMCCMIGENGARLLKDNYTVLTHCNAGALATAGMGTALAAIYVAVSQGKRISVIADETRPLLQGSRLTAWEMVTRKIGVTVVCDSAAAWVMKQGRVDCVMIGADRVARNGDLANKVGSYSLAIAAREHKIPFYVACPYSTIDESLPDGSAIPVEEREESELRLFAGKKVVPNKARVYNPAFDIVPHEYVTAIVTEKCVIRPPFERRLCGARKP